MTRNKKKKLLHLAGFAALMCVQERSQLYSALAFGSCITKPQALLHHPSHRGKICFGGVQGREYLLKSLHALV